MKIRKIKYDEKLKDNEFLINADKKGLLAVSLNIKSIFSITSSFFKLSIEDSKQQDEINTFVTENMSKVIKIFTEEIENTLDVLFMVFCNPKDSLFQVKLFFFIFNKRIENLIALLIVSNFRKRVLGSFYAKRKIKRED